ncbi:MAG: hypothetical protein K6A81_01695, partial [Clostridiales bacterium]|nr:hypothetical protein [Clostridiales bacterium]
GSIIIKILKKSFDKTPDAPSFTEKPGSAIALKNLTKLADVVFFIVLIVISINIVTANLGGNSETRQQEIIAEYDALKEDNVNPETGKTILTQAFLMKEYKLYFAEDQERVNFWLMICKVMLIFSLFFTGGECITHAILFARQKKKLSLLSIIAAILLVPITIIGLKIDEKAFEPFRIPVPENAKISAIEVTVTERHINTHHDEENGDSEDYFITVDYGDGNAPVTRKVSITMYDIAKGGDHFLMGQAGENGKTVDFELFPLDKYEKTE